MVKLSAGWHELEYYGLQFDLKGRYGMHGYGNVALMKVIYSPEG